MNPEPGLNAGFLVGRQDVLPRAVKLLWTERAVVLPGCLLGVYDLGRGLCRRLYFSADAAASEMTRAKAALADLPRNTLMLGDRLYGTADFFAALAAHRCWGVVPRHRQLSLHTVQRLRKRRIRAVCCRTGWSTPAPAARPPSSGCATSAGAVEARATSCSPMC